MADTGFDIGFERSDDATAGGTFAAVGNVMEASPPSVSRDTVETTHSKSTEAWREFIGGLKDAGEASVTLQYDPGASAIASLYSDLNTDTPGYYKLIFPDATEWGLPALVTGIEPGTPIDNLMTVVVTFKVTGKPGWIA
ncbi:MAG: phage tail tube protein [Pseudomonadota bacterium]